MYSKCLILIFLTAVLCFVNSGRVLPKCRRNDEECLLRSTKEMLPSFAAGIPEYNVVATDPLYIESTDASTKDLQLFVRNALMRGVKDCTVEKQILTDDKIIGQIMCDLTVDGQYEMSGKLLVIPIQGKGDVHVKLNRVRFYGEGDLVKYIGDDGKEHWKVNSFKHSYDLTEKAYLTFSDIFNGSDELNKAVREVIENYPNEIIADIGSPSVEAVATAMFDNIDNFFKKNAIEDLFLQE